MKSTRLSTVDCLGRLSVVLILLAATLAGSSAKAETVTTASLLDEMTDLAGMAEFPSPAYTCKQFSSYDRAARSPEDNWFANGDCGQYSKGWNLYFPIPYAKSCRVSNDQDGFCYHVNSGETAGRRHLSREVHWSPDVHRHRPAGRSISYCRSYRRQTVDLPRSGERSYRRQTVDLPRSGERSYKTECDS